jgi:hypothetical protein
VGIFYLEKIRYICGMRTSGTTKWEITYEDEETVSVFKYNSDINKNGPISVEFRYKTGFKHPTEQKKKTLGELAKEARKQTRVKK